MAAGTTAGRTRVERGIYRQPNGKLTVCARRAGRLHFRTAGTDLSEARRARADLIAALETGRVPASPHLRLDTVASLWSERFEAMVAAGDRRPRTYEAHRFHLDHDLLPRLGRRRVASLGVEDVAGLISELRAAGRSAKTTANSLATLQSVLRFARRRGWILADPVELLEPWERPRPSRRPRGRVLGRAEIERLLGACPPHDRLLVETALFSGLRISELLGLVWTDVDFAAGLIRVRAQLSRAHRGEPARRVAPKTPASVREIPLVPQLAGHLGAHRQGTPFPSPTDWVFPTSRGTPLGERNVARRVLKKAADEAGLNDEGRPALRFHDLRHTFASHLIIDLGLDVAQVSRILGHARITITLDIYTHLFDDARHGREIRRRMAASDFAALLAPDQPEASISALRAPPSRRSRTT
ncbi:MAG TPA: site-specific integrase [Solirubrobacterales bacterium]|nr:site-specific integrase [Solirubrobacterales bacterium]